MAQPRANPRNKFNLCRKIYPTTYKTCHDTASSVCNVGTTREAGSGAAEKVGPTRVPKGKLALPKEAIGSGSFGQTSNPQNIHIGKATACLDVGALMAVAKYRGQYEERVKSVLNEVEKAAEDGRPDVILFIDEMHLFMSRQGGEGGGYGCR